MNRNVESHFSMLPGVDVERSRFDRSQDIKFTFNVGELIPFYVDEVLPGDTFDITTSKVIRLQTLLTPVMDNIYLDTYFFFVANRLVMDHWRELMGENTQSAWLPETTYQVPAIVFKANEGDITNPYVEVGDILDYMGVPVGKNRSSSKDGFGSSAINALPYRAYQLIYDEWFRDENLQDPVNINKGDGTFYYGRIPYNLKKPYNAGKYHDYFTSALPSPQKGPKVAAPIYSVDDNGIPVYTAKSTHDSSGYGLFGDFKATQGTTTWSKGILRNVSASDFSAEFADRTAQGSPLGNIGFVPTNLYADITSGTVGIDINSLRLAIQVQRLYERDARGGTRYIEMLKAHFGVDNPDYRLQRPEYLGGNRIPISIHQITNQSQGENDFLGDLGAMSLTTDKNNDFVKSFTEHGFLIGVCVARYDHSYPQGLERFWTRFDRLDYYFPVFAHLGEQAIRKQEIYWDPDDDGNINAFGYQERWAEYRYKPNRVAAEMRPGISNSLASWHFADHYLVQPTLSSGWIQEDKLNVDRTLAVSSGVSDQIFCDIYVQNYTTRCMPMYSIPGLMDHF